MRRWTSVVAALSLLAAGGCTRSARPDVAPVEQKVAAGDVTIVVRSFGGRPGAPTLIVVGGGPGVSHHYVLGLARLAGPELRVVFYDQRGTGASTAPVAERWELAAYVEELEAVRAALGVERAALLGHSWGGLVALAYAAAHPEHVETLAVVDGSALHAAAMDRSQARFKARMDALVAEHVLPAPPEISGDDCMPWLRWQGPVYFADPSHPAARGQQGTCSMRALDKTFTALATYDERPDASRIRAPVLAIFGALDPFGLEALEDLVRALPSTRKVVIPNCGHIPWLECPASFYPVIESFVAARP